MCGIAGLISLGGEGIDPYRLKAMTDIISHRGRDDAGYAFFSSAKDGSGAGYSISLADPMFGGMNEGLPVFGSGFAKEELARNHFAVGLGHRRLAIIDRSWKGHQPMSSPDGRLWVVFNGEIYNHPDLRDKLKQKGYEFQTSSDTEVIIHLWKEYGEDCLSVLNGMFAFAIYDHRANVITLARDRYGVKPLYYAAREGVFAFASETKAILKSGIMAPRVNPDAVVEYFTFQNILSSQTLFDGVNLLPPGEFIRVSTATGKVEAPRKYHRLYPVGDHALGSTETLADTVAETFETAVRRNLLSDVEVGAYLSGGIDSGSIVAVTSRSIKRLLTFTCGFDLTNVNGIEQGNDERREAELLANLFGTEHYDVVLHSGDMPAAMEQISWHVDDPRVGMCHQNWYVSKLAGRFVRVCLSGTGGDEIFGGYPWRYMAAMRSKGFEEMDRDMFTQWHRLLPQGEIVGLFNGDMRKHLQRPWESFMGVMSDAPAYADNMSLADNLVTRAMYFEFKTFLHGLLVIEDRIGMAHNMEVRVPFLDNDLVDLAFRIAPSIKLDIAQLMKRNGSHIETVEGKSLMRKSATRYLPAEITSSKKKGFSPPDENWFKGPSMNYIREILLDKRTLQREWFDQKFVRERLDEHFTGKRNNRLLIWSLLTFECLQRHFIDAKA